MSADSWVRCRPEVVVVGDAVAISGRDPSGDAWTLSGRVRRRGDNGTLIVEWTARSGSGDPPYSLWSNQIVRRDRLTASDLRRHTGHGPAERTDEAGLAYLHELLTTNDTGRIAACIRPGTRHAIGEDEAIEIFRRKRTPPEWLVRQLDGRITAEQAKAYVSVVQASLTTALCEPRPQRSAFPDDHEIYADPDVKWVLAALGGRVVGVREHTTGDVETVEVDDGQE